ncbi:hypothetical protein BdWA1_002191 [Babesia duncani]|uniref:Uncharacterized protein n=1 Tax=Babesia duncani TaxID=323732 RepID=A0AAD9PHQ4_9APIC|nr:hypothetical protein BdWA1_003640 [Babesia duncani]KAK2196942.1 hypothetical protein BdWA1_002191 [Babesia duncani]
MDTQWLYTLSLIGLSTLMVVVSFPITNSTYHRDFIKEVGIAINDMNASHDPTLIIEIINKCKEYETLFVNDLKLTAEIFFKEPVEHACPNEMTLLRDHYTKICNELKNKRLMIKDLKRRVIKDIRQQRTLGIQQKNDIMQLLYGANKREKSLEIFEKIEQCLGENMPLENIHEFFQIFNETKKNLKYDISINTAYMNSLKELQFMKRYPNVLNTANKLMESHIKGLELEKTGIETNEKAAITLVSLDRQ